MCSESLYVSALFIFFTRGHVQRIMTKFIVIGFLFFFFLPMFSVSKKRFESKRFCLAFLFSVQRNRLR